MESFEFHTDFNAIYRDCEDEEASSIREKVKNLMGSLHEFQGKEEMDYIRDLIKKSKILKKRNRKNSSRKNRKRKKLINVFQCPLIPIRDRVIFAGNL